MKHLELIKFILGLTFCSIALLGAIIFFLGYWHFIANPNYSEFNNYSSTWLSYNNHGTYTPIFLGICGVCGVYLLKNVEVKE